MTIRTVLLALPAAYTLQDSDGSAVLVSTPAASVASGRNTRISLPAFTPEKRTVVEQTGSVGRRQTPIVAIKARAVLPRLDGNITTGAGKQEVMLMPHPGIQT